MTWKVEFDDRAARELRKFDPQIQGQILAYLRKRIATSENTRRFGKTLSGGLRGLWRYRVRDYRLICAVPERATTFVILRIGRRGTICA